MGLLHRLPALLILALAGGCGPTDLDSSSQQREAESKTERVKFNIMGDFRAAKNLSADQIVKILDSAFFKELVPCSNNQQLALGIWRLSRIGLDEDSAPTLLGWGVDEVQLKDGQGKAVAVV